MAHSQLLTLSSFIIIILSLIASLIVLLLHLTVKEIRSHFFFRIAFHISFSDLLFSLSSLYTQNPTSLDPNLCTALGVTRELAWLASISWTTILPYTIHKSLKESLSDEELGQNKKLYFVSAYLFPIIFSIVPAVAVKKLYGPSEMYCWIAGDHKYEFLAKSLLVYLPLLVSGILTGFWCYKMRKWVKFLLRRTMSQDFIKLLYFPLIMFLCNSGVVAHGFVKEFFGGNGNLLGLLIVMRQAQGLLNGLVYILNNQVRKAVRRKWKRKINRERSNSDGQDLPFIYNFSSSFVEDSGVNNEDFSKYFNTKTTMIETE